MPGYRSNFIRCRFCSTSVIRKTVTNEDGSTRDGMDRLKDHIEVEHPDEFDAIYLGEQE